MIHEHSPITNSFVSVPADMGQLNCAAFIAGIIAGILDSAKFNAKVTAHLVPVGEAAGSGSGSSISGAINAEALAKILTSFPYHSMRPGVLKNDDISGGLKHLGDLVLSPAYIVKQCERDRKEFEKKQLEASNGAELVKSSDDTDAGVSKAMSQGYFSLEERLPLFLIHGILHLVGYDHENDKDYLLMTKEEERILRLLEGLALTAVIWENEELGAKFKVWPLDEAPIPDDLKQLARKTHAEDYMPSPLDRPAIQGVDAADIEK
eukprot:gene19071-19425_t